MSGRPHIVTNCFVVPTYTRCHELTNRFIGFSCSCFLVELTDLLCQ